MQKELFHTNKGFSLIELVISAAMVLLFSVLFTNTILAGQEGSVSGGTHTRAVLVAEEGLEAARNIRDANFANLTLGPHGVGISGGTWVFVGSSDVEDIFTRTVTVTTVDATTRQVTSQVVWRDSAARPATTTLTTYLGNLGPLPPAKQAGVLLVNTSAAAIGGASSAELRNILLQNTGSSSVSITKLKVSWSPSANKMTQAIVGGTLVWSNSGPGSPALQQSSGATTTIATTTIAAGNTVPLDKLLFTGNMHNNSFTIVFTFADNSQKTVSIPTLP